MAVTSGMIRVLLQACAFGAPLLASSIVLAQQPAIAADEGMNINGFRSQAGKIVTFVCPAITKYRDIWGTDVYSYDSPVCTAAVHAGALKPGIPGQVTIRVGATTELFRASVRNDVTSLSYGAADTTYSFVSIDEPAQIDWRTIYGNVPDDFRMPITVVCPAGGNPDSFGGLIGTDVYRSDSAICVAAVHAKVITPSAGGPVTVTLQPKQEALAASERNGVSSQSWKDWNYAAYPQPYSVTPGTLVASAPAVESGPGETSRRTLRLVGFTAVGSAPIIVPRIVQLSGFTAEGTALEIKPRIVRIDGWTGTGTARK